MVEMIKVKIMTWQSNINGIREQSEADLNRAKMQLESA